MYIWDGKTVGDPGEIDPDNPPRAVGRMESLARTQEETMKAYGISSKEALAQMRRAFLEGLHGCDMPLGALQDLLVDIEFLAGGG